MPVMKIGPVRVRMHHGIVAVPMRVRCNHRIGMVMQMMAILVRVGMDVLGAIATSKVQQPGELQGVEGSEQQFTSGDRRPEQNSGGERQDEPVHALSLPSL